MNLTITQADYSSAAHCNGILMLLDHYAKDPMGGGSGLRSEVRQNLIAALAKREFAVLILAFHADFPVGLVNAFEGFSTFACKPLLNIHDVVVHSDYRRRGISRLLLEKTQQIAMQRGCCKLTLEVLSNNCAALKAYRDFGFNAYQLDPEAGKALFWEKKVSQD